MDEDVYHIKYAALTGSPVKPNRVHFPATLNPKEVAAEEKQTTSRIRMRTPGGTERRTGARSSISPVL